MDFNIMTREAYDRLVNSRPGLLAQQLVPHDDNPQLPPQPAPKADITDPAVPFHAGCDD